MGDVAGGLILTYIGGDMCGYWNFPDHKPHPRQTNVTFLCDPDAGVGAPVADDPIEQPTCSYHFVWPSAYACPLCTTDDYSTILHECDSNGEQVVSFVWNNARCHAGVPLPSSFTRSCNDNTVA